MPYYQNVIDQEFRGNWIIGDRQYTLNFNIRGNLNTATLMMAYTPEPYDLSSDNTLTINYAIDPTLKQFQALAINVAGATPATTLAWEVAAALNANATFAALWTAYVREYKAGKGNIVYLQSSRPNTAIRAYISNTSAEQHLHFNANAPIAQLPSYFARHTIANALVYPDSFAGLLALNAGDTYTASMITLQGQDPMTVKPDWQLLQGRAGLFDFQKISYDGSSRISTIIEYPAGAIAGDLGKKTIYAYTGANVNPSTVAEIPYVIQSGDLFTP